MKLNPWIEQPEKEISILLPTRGRTEMLRDSVLSLVRKAKDPKSIELLLGVDIDDKASLEWAKENFLGELSTLGVDIVIMDFEPMGYEKLHDYVNGLATASRGRWLFFWNDDAIMQTDNWDEHITAHNGEFACLRMMTHKLHPYSIFPVVPREWFFLIGKLSSHQLSDAWLSQIAYMLDIMKNIDVHVIHDRADLTGNNKDETFNNRVIFEGNHLDPRDFNFEKFRKQRFYEANKIAWYLQNIGQDVAWFRLVATGQKDPWEKMLSPEFDPNNQVKVYK